MVFNATFNNISVISWRSVLLVEGTGVPGGNYRPVARHWQTLSHNAVQPSLIEIRTHNINCFLLNNKICLKYNISDETLQWTSRRAFTWLIPRSESNQIFLRIKSECSIHSRWFCAELLHVLNILNSCILLMFTQIITIYRLYFVNL